MAVKKKLATARESTLAVKDTSSCKEVIHRVLATIREIDAVFLLRDDANVVHVFSVVNEFQSKIYDTLLRKEHILEKDLPEIALEFHVRAHQGREPAQAVPYEAELVYARC